jgi:hypothetical protein
MKKYMALVLVVLVGCMTVVPMAPTEDDANAKKFEVREGKANVYVYRLGGLACQADAAPIVLSDPNIASDKHLTDLNPNTFYEIASVDPGVLRIVASLVDDKRKGVSYVSVSSSGTPSFNPGVDVETVIQPGEIYIVAKANTNYFVQVGAHRVLSGDLFTLTFT